MTQRIRRFSDPFVPPHVERPKPMARPNIWQSARSSIRRGWAWLHLLTVDAQLDEATREAWKLGRLGHLAEQAGEVDEAEWYEAEGIRLAGEIAKLRRRQRVLENEVKGE